jgi:hypothetical protein
MTRFTGSSPHPETGSQAVFPNIMREDAEGPDRPVSGSHSHRHEHGLVEHEHPQGSDLHHRHRHR